MGTVHVLPEAEVTGGSSLVDTEGGGSADLMGSSPRTDAFINGVASRDTLRAALRIAGTFADADHFAGSSAAAGTFAADMSIETSGRPAAGEYNGAFYGDDCGGMPGFLLSTFLTLPRL